MSYLTWINCKAVLRYSYLKKEQKKPFRQVVVLQIFKAHFCIVFFYWSDVIF